FVGAKGGFGVGEAALEPLEVVAEGDVVAEIKRQPQLIHQVEHRHHDELEQQLNTNSVNDAAEEVVKIAVGDNGDGDNGNRSRGDASEDQRRAIEGENGIDVGTIEEVAISNASDVHRLAIDRVED